METYQKEKLNLTFYKGVKMETNKSPVNFHITLKVRPLG